MDYLQWALDENLINKFDAVMADKGFTIDDELEKLNIHLNIPPFIAKDCQMTQSEVTPSCDNCRNLSAHRLSEYIMD